MVAVYFVHLLFPYCCFPLLVEDIILSRDPIDHIELYYQQAVHYEAIISTDNKMCITPPQLTGETDPDIIVLDS